MSVSDPMYQDRASTSASENAETITLTGRDLADARSLLEQLSALVSGPIQETNETVMTEKPKARLSGRQAYLEIARKAFIARRRRSQHFKKGMFGEPAWEILLALYIRDTSGGRLTITRLTDMIGLPPTSGLRWLDYLEKEHLVERESHPTDLRAFFVHLTDKGRTSMDSYFSETLTTEA